MLRAKMKRFSHHTTAAAAAREHCADAFISQLVTRTKKKREHWSVNHQNRYNFSYKNVIKFERVSLVFLPMTIVWTALREKNNGRQRWQLYAKILSNPILCHTIGVGNFYWWPLMI